MLKMIDIVSREFEERRWRLALVSLALALVLTLAVSARHTTEVSAQGPAVPVVSQTFYGGWPYNWYGGGYWPYNWNSGYWPYNSYGGYWPYNWNSGYWPYNAYGGYWPYIGNANFVQSVSSNVVPGVSSPAWIWCSAVGGGPVWVQAGHSTAGLLC
jgi:hypothetical protein